jgi:hypothetical protein
MNILNIFKNLSLPLKLGVGILVSFVLCATIFFIIRTYFKPTTKKEGFQENTTAAKEFTFTVPSATVCLILQNHIKLTKESLDEATNANDANRVNIFSTLLSSMNEKFETLNCVFNKDELYIHSLERTELNPIIEFIKPKIPITSDVEEDEEATPDVQVDEETSSEQV